MIDGISLPPCMGGWCLIRENCAQYHLNHGKPRNRLCKKGKDGELDYSYLDDKKPNRRKRVIIESVQDLKDQCHVDEETQCWHWLGARRADGEPKVIACNGHISSIHTALALLEGVQPTRHNNKSIAVCGTPNCANPDHREIKSRRVFKTDEAAKNIMAVPELKLRRVPNSIFVYADCMA